MIASTDDTGNTWTIHETTTTVTLLDGYFPTDSSGWLIGESGIILCTDVHVPEFPVTWLVFPVTLIAVGVAIRIKHIINYHQT